MESKPNPNFKFNIGNKNRKIAEIKCVQSQQSITETNKKGGHQGPPLTVMEERKKEQGYEYVESEAEMAAYSLHHRAGTKAENETPNKSG